METNEITATPDGRPIWYGPKPKKIPWHFIVQESTQYATGFLYYCFQPFGHDDDPDETMICVWRINHKPKVK